jgi:hypothetical protein
MYNVMSAKLFKVVVLKAFWDQFVRKMQLLLKTNYFKHFINSTV